MKRRIVMLILCGVLIFSENTQIFAEDVLAENMTEILPCIDYMDQLEARLYVDSNGNTTVKCTAYGLSGTTTRIEISAKLQRNVNGSWVTLKTLRQKRILSLSTVTFADERENLDNVDESMAEIYGIPISDIRTMPEELYLRLAKDVEGVDTFSVNDSYWKISYDENGESVVSEATYEEYLYVSTGFSL